MIAGPNVYICDECIDLCNDIIAEECDVGGAASIPEASPTAALSPLTVCKVCHFTKPALEILAVPNVGVVCHSCADAIRSIADAELPPPQDLSSLDPLVERPCCLCGLILAPSSLLAIPSRGELCGQCLDAINVAARKHGVV